MRSSIKIGDDISGLKIFEIINECFDKSLKGWMKAWYDIDENFAAWFPKIAKEAGTPDGNYGGTRTYNNTISDDGMYIFERNYTPDVEVKELNTQKVLVFGRKDDGFEFLGVFEYTDREKADYIKTTLTRIATGVDLKTFEFINEVASERVGQFDSWTILSDDVAIKKCDKSFFKYKGSGVPIAIRWYFDADELEAGEDKSITLEFEGQQYNASIKRLQNATSVTQIGWKSDLGNQFSEYDNTGSDEENIWSCKFTKKAEGYYTLEFVKENQTEKGGRNMTEWISSGNPAKYDCIKAFRDLKKVDWRQSTNVAVGDIVYIYVSNTEQAIRLKCKVNQVDLKEPTIDDSKYNVSGEFDGTYGRYMELELLTELTGDLYTRENLGKHGFTSPQSPVRLRTEIKDYLDLVQRLQNAEEMDPDQHDGSYALLRSVINAYENMGQDVTYDFNDLNLVYLMTIGTWRHTVPAKEKVIAESNLSDQQKEVVLRKLHAVWENAGKGLYGNQESGSQNIGMFGTGFFSFKNKTDDVSPQQFIQMCISIMHMTDEERIFERCEEVLTKEFKGMGAAAASMILHCLKPTLFPVINGNSGYENIYEYLGVKLNNKTAVDTYIENCRRIKEFRDKHFSVKNYRIFDIAARNIGDGEEHTNIDYLGILDYLENNRGVPYQAPEKKGLTDEERQQYLQVKKKGQDIVAELKKIYEHCKDKFDFTRCEKISWDDGTHQKTRSYLWIPMKYGKYSSRHESISIFVEMTSDNTAIYRISLELRNDKTNAEDVRTYHRHLDLPLNEEAGLVYVAGSNEFDRPALLTETQDEIKAKVEKRIYDKVQICKYISSEEYQTNDAIEAAIDTAISELLPYYEYVLGETEEAYWPSLEEYNPGITVEKWVELLSDPSIIKKEYLDLLSKILEQGGASTCAHLEEVYGGTQGAYNAYGRSIGQAVMSATGCECIQEEGRYRYYTIPFVGRNVLENGNRRYSWKLRDELREALESMDLSEIEKKQDDSGRESSEFDKNMILYGPPGTGKTYNTAIYAVAICDGKSREDVAAASYQEVLQRYNELKKEGRIAFTTFHQSYGYEEFIEGIKPVMDEDNEDIGYTIKDGVFKAFCDRASKVTIDAKNRMTNDAIRVRDSARLWCVILGGNDNPGFAKKCFDEGTIRIGWQAAPQTVTEEEDTLNNKERRMLLNFQDEMEIGDIVVSRASATEINGVGIITGEYEYDASNSRYPRKHNVDWLYTGDPINVFDLNGQVKLGRYSVYQLTRISPDELLKLIPNKDNMILDETRSYVFIIDEINRGNISKIFGELITLIETTKRKGAAEAAEAILPYSNTPFGVPNNVYIIGTMNTADRSIALMDTALRRRFQFIEMMPDAEVLRSIGADKVKEGETELDVALMLETINQRIEYLYDREHTIGHAFFTGLRENPTVKKLGSIFKKSVLPLLQEYFYEDYSKIMLVLGDNGKQYDVDKFILAEEIKSTSIFRGDTSDIDIPDYSYKIQEEAFYNINAYKEIIG